MVGKDFELDEMKPFKPISLPSTNTPAPVTESSYNNYKRNNKIRRPTNYKDDEEAQFLLKKMFVDFNRMVKSGYRNTRRVIGRYVQGVRKMTSDSSSGGGGKVNTRNNKNNKNVHYDRVDATADDEEDQGLYLDLSPVWGMLYQPSD